MTTNKDECCPKFIPEKWDEKTFNWDNRPFVMDSIPTFFHMPFPPMIGKKIKKMWGMVEEQEKAIAPKEDTLILFRDPSAFKSEIYVGTVGEVKGANNVTLSGTFEAKDYYVHYAYCPRCVKETRHNYMILFARI